jgi:leader peptidase (prepilin peptidase)/N-methyltransferase
MYNANMGAFIIFPFLLGLLAAWVVNYLADVLPESLKFTRPLCSNKECAKPYAWADYLLLRRCRHCGKHRGIRTYAVILLTVLSALYLWISAPAKLGFGLGFLALSYFYIVGIIDFEHRLILGPLSIAGLFIGGAAGWLLHGWQSTLIGGAAGFAIMLVFYLLGKLFTHVRARRRGEDPGQAEEALGSGDVTLVTVLGLFLGWPYIWFGLLVGALLAGAVSLIIILALLIGRKYKEQAFMVFIPMGPMFILSAIMIVYLPQIVRVMVPK